MFQLYRNQLNRLSLVIMLLGSLSCIYSQANIPVLTWPQEMSDWVNVKTGVTPGAVGNGIADDADAIQKVLDMVGSNFTPSAGMKVCYLPAGTYRITKTLTLAKRNGGSIIGCGRNTKIIWDGAVGGVMFLSNGATEMCYNGIVWDGNNKAGVGFDHASTSGGIFECKMRHENEAFINFSAASGVNSAGKGAAGAVGLRFAMGECGGGLATSETMVRNCLFVNCYNGAMVNCGNYLNIQFEGCEFRNCWYGTWDYSGQHFVRDCHFEGNKICDIWGSISVMRCTSTGSAMFLEQGDELNNANQMFVQDCHVANWTNTNGAIHLSTPANANFDFGNNIVFDCEFSSPPNQYPPVRIDEKGITQTITSNNSSTGTDSVFIVSGTSARQYSKFTKIPYVSGTNRCAPTHLLPTQSFLKTEVPAPTVMYDVKKDYAGNIQNAIIAATQVKGSVVYLASGEYKISKTITVAGSDYTIMGAGARTWILWDQTVTSDVNSVILKVQNPKHITIKNLSISPNQSTFKGKKIVQTSTGGPSYVTYDNIWLEGYVPDKGLVMSELTALDTVHIVRINGTDSAVVANDCQRATIYANFLDNGGFFLFGSKYPSTGFFGVQQMNTIEYGACVYNSQNAIVGSFYSEQGATPRVILKGGMSLTDPTNGKVTVGFTKLESWGTRVWDIDNYSGKAAFVGGHGTGPFYHTGTNPVTFTFLATEGGNVNTFTPTAVGTGATFQYVAFKSGQLLYPGVMDTKNTTAASVLTECSYILDDFRNLGEKDLLFNYGIQLGADCIVPVINTHGLTTPISRQVVISERLIQLPDAQKYTIEIFNARGALVHSLIVHGMRTVALPAFSTSSIYMIKVKGPSQIMVKKQIAL